MSKVSHEAALNQLNPAEKRELAECRLIIQEGFQTFVEVGQALGRIQHKRLYRATHETFEAFCRAEFDMGRSYAYRLIESSRVIEDLSPIGDKLPLPANESQVRILAELPTPEQRRSAWRKVIDVTEGGGSAITAKLVRSVIRDSVGKGGKKAPGTRRQRLSAGVVISRAESFVAGMEKLLRSGRSEEALNLLSDFKKTLSAPVSGE